MTLLDELIELSSSPFFLLIIISCRDKGKGLKLRGRSRWEFHGESYLMKFSYVLSPRNSFMLIYINTNHKMYAMYMC